MAGDPRPLLEGAPQENTERPTIRAYVYLQAWRISRRRTPYAIDSLHPGGVRSRRPGRGARLEGIHVFPAYSFSVAFPANPKIETTTYQASDGRTVEARVYSVTQASSLLRMTVADLSGAPIEDTAAIDHAVETLTQGSEIKVDVPHRIGSVYGRQLSIDRSDGSHSFFAVFYRKWRLYQIEGIALSVDQGARAAAIRFQQSLNFQQSLDFTSASAPPLPP